MSVMDMVFDQLIFTIKTRPVSLLNYKHTCVFMAASRHHKADSSFAKAYSSSTPSNSSSRFSYHIAASFIGKDRPFDPSSHVYHFNPYNRVHAPRTRRRSSRPDSGHDAFFVSRIQDTGSVAFGVADGVGGWVDSGVDPADFSHGLCDHMAASAYAHDAGNSSTRLTARRLMQKGYDAVCDDRSLQGGGSTACVGIAAPDGTFEVANLGDSGFLQLRLNAVNAYSEPQTHAFNTPFQLSLVPPSIAARMAAFGGSQLCDLPRDADVSQHYVRHGDILMFATDGVLDNLFRHDILKIVSRVMVSTGAWQGTPAGGVRVGDTIDLLTKPSSSGDDNSEPAGKVIKTKPITLQSLLATEIVAAAKAASINTKVDGPFAKEVQKYYPHDEWRGGKVDDICVVVAVVSEDLGDARSKL
ncbi:hypothetical protein E4U43_004107 [Claviceps pusilla]|uniref:Protein phosphatase n=1 Tax=Claviceps pusilla TaxID=123648 RepID=A0A9P7SZB8_9HYPO|nr:hypothetical protein E4U43_004107 [Claviceps pusilla]